MHINDRVFLITGGASGLGAACARSLIARGGRVVVADRSEKGADFAAELGVRARFIACDVTSSDSMRAVIAYVKEQFHTLDGAICCAGILGASRVLGRDGPHDLELFRRVVEVNLIGSFNTARLAAEVMQSQPPGDDGERGVLIFTSSVAAEEGQIGQAAYSASKGGINALVLPLARELGKHGIRAVAIAPGVFETPLMAAVTDELRTSLERQVPFPPRLGRPEEFAALAAQVIENVMLNGTVIRLDGALRMAAK